MQLLVTKDMVFWRLNVAIFFIIICLISAIPIKKMEAQSRISRRYCHQPPSTFLIRHSIFSAHVKLCERKESLHVNNFQLTLINVAQFQGLRGVAPSSKCPCLKKTFE